MNLLDAIIVIVLVISLLSLLFGLYFFWLQQQELAEQNRSKSPVYRVMDAKSWREAGTEGPCFSAYPRRHDVRNKESKVSK